MESNFEKNEKYNPWPKPEWAFNYQNMSLPKRFMGHLKTITTHKFYVAQGCFKLGLYYQGIMHDLSKYSPCEFITGVKYFDGHRSPNAVERASTGGYSMAWLHHKGRNKHHFEYWIDYSNLPGRLVYGNRMPLRYVAEMICDRRAACLTYNNENYTPSAPWEHYLKSKDHLVMDKDTRIVLENCLTVLKDEGEEAGFEFIRGLLSVTKGRDYTAESLGLKDITNMRQLVAD